MDKKIVIFSRTSTTQQDIEQQTHELQQEALRLGYTPANQVLIEYQESGIKLDVDERKGIARLKNAITSDSTIDCMLCWELTRLARRADVIYNIRDFLIEHKIRFIIMKPSYIELITREGEVTPTMSLMLGIFTSFAESEMAVKAARFKRAKESLTAQGKKSAGSVIFGYMKDADKHCVPHPENSKILTNLFHHYITHDDTSLYETYQWAMKQWPHLFPLREYIKAQHHIRHLFTTEVYVTGNWCYPPLITQEIWDKTHDKMSKAQCKPRYRSKLQLLGRGKVICAHCGNVMTASGGNVNGYCCSTDKQHSLQMNISVLEWLIWEEVRVAVNIAASASKTERIAELTQQIKERTVYIEQLQHAIQDITERQDKLVSLYLDNRITESIYNRRYNDMTSEMQQTQQQLNDVQIQINELNASLQQSDDDFGSGVSTVDNITDFDVRLEYTRKLLDKVILEKQQDKVINISFTWQRPMILARSTYQYIALGGRRKIWRINEDSTRDFIYNNKPL